MWNHQIGVPKRLETKARYYWHPLVHSITTQEMPTMGQILFQCLPQEHWNWILGMARTRSVWLVWDCASPNSLLSVVQVRTLSLLVVLGFFQMYLFLEKGKGRKKERDRNIEVWNIHELPLVRPLLGTWPQPRHMPLLGIEAATLWFAGWLSIHWPTQPGPMSYILYLVSSSLNNKNSTFFFFLFEWNKMYYIILSSSEKHHARIKILRNFSPKE